MGVDERGDRALEVLESGDVDGLDGAARERRERPAEAAAPRQREPPEPRRPAGEGEIAGDGEEGPEREVLEACDKLRYRDFLIVTLVLDHADPFPDNWIYIHEPDVQVGRIQNFRAWSKEMVPDDSTASIGMEYFCHEGDGLWSSTDEDLIELAKKELAELGLAPAESVIDGKVIRQPKAYPVYDAGYQERVEIIRRWLDGFETLETSGRNGMHRYNNQDHSMVSAMVAAERLLDPVNGGDPWSVNVERSYQEEFRVKPRPQEQVVDA